MRFAALQSSYGKEALSEMGKETDDISTVIYIRSNSQFYIKSNAVLEVMKETNSGLYAIAVILGIIPLPIRDRFYDLVAKNRYNFLGKRDTCRCSDKEYSDRFLS
jgi:predicted DCC family thiol-disulfide oxidoreductase YuxK